MRTSLPANRITAPESGTNRRNLPTKARIDAAEAISYHLGSAEVVDQKFSTSKAALDSKQPLQTMKDWHKLNPKHLRSSHAICQDVN